MANIVGSKIQADNHHSHGMEEKSKNKAGIPTAFTGLGPLLGMMKWAQRTFLQLSGATGI